ncbi:Uncharacterized protein Rs2_02790 [Raphanus sativus]|nr:Uncharacterized protein Rs2_02790 [Raphanus sativus]
MQNEDSNKWKDDGLEGSSSRMIVPYEQSTGHLSLSSHNSEEKKRTETSSARKIASTIVTPSRVENTMESNVTVRNMSEGRTLSFSPSNGKEPIACDDQIIGALTDMEMMDQSNGDMMEEDVEDDDLLGIDLMEMEVTKFAASKDTEEGQGSKSTRPKKQSKALQVGEYCMRKHTL